jgi:hypothetical protein
MSTPTDRLGDLASPRYRTMLEPLADALPDHACINSASGYWTAKWSTPGRMRFVDLRVRQLEADTFGVTSDGIALTVADPRSRTVLVALNMIRAYGGLLDADTTTDGAGR